MYTGPKSGVYNFTVDRYDEVGIEFQMNFVVCLYVTVCNFNVQYMFYKLYVNIHFIVVIYIE